MKNAAFNNALTVVSLNTLPSSAENKRSAANVQSQNTLQINVQTRTTTKADVSTASKNTHHETFDARSESRNRRESKKRT
jgi:hypothetical protein